MILPQINFSGYRQIFIETDGCASALFSNKTELLCSNGRPMPFVAEEMHTDNICK